MITIATQSGPAAVHLDNSPTTRTLRCLMADAIGIGMMAAMDYVVAEGDAAPVKTGKGGYWTTPNGSICHHPNAYRRAYGKPIYHGSTRKITVGIGWLARVLGATLHPGNDLREQVNILCVLASRYARLTEKARAEAIYAAANPVPAGRVLFDTEGGFRVLPSGN